MTLFDLVNPSYEINKPIRLIETFAGYGQTYRDMVGWCNDNGGITGAEAE